MLYGIDPTKFKAGYPRFHQFGATIPPRFIEPTNAKALRFFYRGKWVFTKKASPKGGRIPVRPFIGLAPEDVERLGDITREYFRRPE
jgi:phage gpG-like protein